MTWGVYGRVQCLDSTHACTLPACLLQLHCALSGEQFEQFWDEEHQEWRYRNAKRLGAEEAQR